MTTAHRPTFDPARGKEAQRGAAYHQRLLPAHTHLKERKAGQGGAAGYETRDLRAELLKAEAAVKARKIGITGDPDALDEDENEEGGVKRKAIEAGDVDEVDANDEDDESPEAKRRRLILEEAREVDADSDSGSRSDDSSEESEEEEEDEQAELMRELAKIKAERAAARAAEEAAEAAKEQEERERDIATGNPLLNKQDFGVKRRWDDDVVFKNQGRGTDEKGKRKEFVNDLLRSDFHKKFMSKYVR